MELGLPCIGEPPYYLVQRREGRRKGKERTSLRNLATPTPEGGEKSLNTENDFPEKDFGVEK